MSYSTVFTTQKSYTANVFITLDNLILQVPSSKGDGALAFAMDTLIPIDQDPIPAPAIATATGALSINMGTMIPIDQDPIPAPAIATATGALSIKMGTLIPNSQIYSAPTLTASR